jgi:hypothetical protein
VQGKNLTLIKYIEYIAFFTLSHAHSPLYNRTIFFHFLQYIITLFFPMKIWCHGTSLNIIYTLYIGCVGMENNAEMLDAIQVVFSSGWHFFFWVSMLLIMMMCAIQGSLPHKKLANYYFMCMVRDYVSVRHGWWIQKKIGVMKRLLYRSHHEYKENIGITSCLAPKFDRARSTNTNRNYRTPTTMAKRSTPRHR